MTKTQFHIYLVGYGNAGKIHLKAYKKLNNTFKVSGIIEHSKEKQSYIKNELENIKVFTSLDELANLDEDYNKIILDLCVPSPEYIKIVNKAKSLGITKMIFEKPIAWSYSEAQKLIFNLTDCQAYYLDTYQFSNGVQQLHKIVSEEESKIGKINIYFEKNRLADSINKRGFTTDNKYQNAWYIEGPHMVSIALQISGEDIKEIKESKLINMNNNDISYYEHGKAIAHMVHENNIETFLYMNLISDKNHRIVEVILENNVKYKLYLPESKSKQFKSYIEKYQNNKLLKLITVNDDRPMENSVYKTLENFLKIDPKFCDKSYSSSISYGLKVNKILEELTKIAK